MLHGREHSELSLDNVRHAQKTNQKTIRDPFQIGGKMRLFANQRRDFNLESKRLINDGRWAEDFDEKLAIKLSQLL